MDFYSSHSTLRLIPKNMIDETGDLGEDKTGELILRLTAMRHCNSNL